MSLADQIRLKTAISAAGSQKLAPGGVPRVAAFLACGPSLKWRFVPQMGLKARSSHRAFVGDRVDVRDSAVVVFRRS